MELADDLELYRLEQDIDASPFKDAVVMASDAKDNFNGLRLSFAAPPDSNGHLRVAQRCIDTRKVHRLNNATLYTPIQQSSAAVGLG